MGYVVCGLWYEVWGMKCGVWLYGVVNSQFSIIHGVCDRDAMICVFGITSSTEYKKKYFSQRGKAAKGELI